MLIKIKSLKKKLKLSRRGISIFIIFLIINIGLDYLFNYLVLRFPEDLVFKNIPCDNIKTNVLVFFIGATIYSPFIEEILFRSILRLNTKNIKLFISSIIAVIMLFVFRPLGSLESKALSLICFIISYSRIRKLNIPDINIKYKKPIIIYSLFTVSSILFGLCHLKYGYIEFDLKNMVLFLRHFIPGITFGYIRLKYGLKWSILMHSLTNALIFLPFLMHYFM
jgi:membrane protease YdiL (CAAX protease family)